MAKTLIMIAQVICAIALIATVILQSGKSAGLSGSIAGGSEAFFGKKKGLDDLLSKITAWVAGAFMVLTLVLALLK